MIVLKTAEIIKSYDFFSRNGHFNIEQYRKVLEARGKNPDEQIEIIKRAKNLKNK